MHNFLFDLTVGALVLGFMVLLHEYGHFVAAKLCGVRVDVFSIGFGPRIWGVKRGDTDYRISALPLGGYVRMAGDNPAEERTGEPYEFLSRPRWQRFIVAVAGPAANILLTFLLLFGVIFFVGMPYFTYTRQAAVVAAVPLHDSASVVKPGDRIVAVDGSPTRTWDDVLDKIQNVKPDSTLRLEVVRNGAQVNLSEPVGEKPVTAESLVGYPELPPILDEVPAGYPAEEAGMKAGDHIVSIDGKPVVTWPQLPEMIHDSGGRTIHFVVERNGKDLAFNVKARYMMNPDVGQSTWLIGANPKTDEAFEHESFFAALHDGGQQTAEYVRMMGEVLGALIQGKLSFRDLAGPVGIVQMSGQAAKRGPLTLINWMAYISLDLGLLNLLPIPIMDGGHVLMLAIEGTLRRDLSLAAKERFVQVGLVFILGIFALVMYSDILRLFQH
jgi:regulator of sigma E protease